MATSRATALRQIDGGCFRWVAGTTPLVFGSCSVRHCQSSTSVGDKPRPLLPLSIVQNARVKAALPTIGNVAYGGLASGFLMTDILHLRTLVCSAYCGIASFHALQEHPLRIPFAWSVLFAGINLVFAIRIMRDRYVKLSEEEELIYFAHFANAMSAPLFKKLIDCGEIDTATERRAVVEKGKVANLVLITSGHAEVKVGEGVVVTITRPGLLGESSFLRGDVASKTVRVAPGGRYIVWQRDSLEELMNNEPELRRGIELTIGRELSRKLGETSSLLIAATTGARDIARHQQIIEYESLVLKHTLCVWREFGLGTRDGRRNGDAPAEVFFDDLAEYRRRDKVPDSVHTTVMERLGINQASIEYDGGSIRNVCGIIAAAQSTHEQERKLSLTADQERPRDVSR